MPLRGLDSVKLAISNLEANTNEKLRGVIFQALGNIQIGTPVDTGRARNNWFLSTKYSSTKITARLSGNEIDIAKIPEKIIGTKIYFTNNLPYIERLEYDGWSNQAPAGWVRAEILRLRKAIRNL